MIDEFDYKEPSCALCGGKEFYNPELASAKGRIPVKRVIEKADEYYNKNDLAGAKRHLEYWEKEAVALNDESGELSVINELLGLYRKNGDNDNAICVIERALFLTEKLEIPETVSAATVYLNAATTYKAVGKADKALPLYERTLKIYTENLDDSDERFGGFYNNYALALTDAGEFTKAEECYFNAIKVMEKAENGKPDLAITYVNLAHLYEQAGKTEKITDCLFKAYDLLNDESNIKNGYYAYVLDKCAPSFKYFGYDKIANDMKKESTEIYERS
ncbi:MAG: tetratricopeptide repeat protein [Clostridia bacterium]|nr:tetratricopeptide repeat protein [Clostridia bacterium]